MHKAEFLLGECGVACGSALQCGADACVLHFRHLWVWIGKACADISDEIVLSFTGDARECSCGVSVECSKCHEDVLLLLGCELEEFPPATKHVPWNEWVHGPEHGSIYHVICAGGCGAESGELHGDLRTGKIQECVFVYESLLHAGFKCARPKHVCAVDDVDIREYRKRNLLCRCDCNTELLRDRFYGHGQILARDEVEGKVRRLSTLRGRGQSIYCGYLVGNTTS